MALMLWVRISAKWNLNRPFCLSSLQPKMYPSDMDASLKVYFNFRSIFFYTARPSRLLPAIELHLPVVRLAPPPHKPRIWLTSNVTLKLQLFSAKVLLSSSPLCSSRIYQFNFQMCFFSFLWQAFLRSRADDSVIIWTKGKPIQTNVSSLIFCSQRHL